MRKDTLVDIVEFLAFVFFFVFPQTGSLETAAEAKGSPDQVSVFRLNHL